MEDKIEVTCFTLENEKDYMLIDKIDKYMYLSNVDDEEDFCVRIDAGEYLEGLKDDQEFDKAMKLFYEKNKDIKPEV